MRISFISGGLPLGGTTTYMLYLAVALRDLGCESKVFSFTNDHPLEEQFLAEDIEAYLCDNKRYIYEDRLKQVYKEVRKFAPDVVVAILGADAFEFLRYIPPGIAKIGVIHDRTGRPELFAARYGPTLDQMVVVSSYLLDDIARVAPYLKCRCIKHGVPFLKSTPIRRPNLSEPLRIIYYGRLEDTAKGVRIFPKIVSALNRRKIPFCFTIHGSGPEKGFLEEALANEQKTGQVIFSSPVSHEKLPLLISNNDVYLLASIHEGGPQTLLESMAIGLVPICGDIPCLIQEVIQKNNGFRVQRDNPDAYAEVVAYLHENRLVLENLSQAARESISQKFSSSRMASQYFDMFQTIVDYKKTPVWPETIQSMPILGAPRLSFSFIGRLMRRIHKFKLK